MAARHRAHHPGTGDDGRPRRRHGRRPRPAARRRRPRSLPRPERRPGDGAARRRHRAVPGRARHRRPRGRPRRPAGAAQRVGVVVRAVPGRAARAGRVRGTRPTPSRSSGSTSRTIPAPRWRCCASWASRCRRSRTRTTPYGGRSRCRRRCRSATSCGRTAASPGSTRPPRSPPRTRWRRPSSGSGPVIGDAPAARAGTRVAAPDARRHPRRRRGHPEPPPHPAAGRRAPQRRPHPVRPRSRARPGRAAHRAGQHPALARGAGVVPRRPDRSRRPRRGGDRPARGRGGDGAGAGGGGAAGRAARPVHPADRLRRRAGRSRTGRTRRPCTRSIRARRPPSSGFR